jgi:hypothetical protein
MVAARQPLLFYDAEHGTVNRYGGWPCELDTGYTSTVWSFVAGSADMNWQRGSNASSKGLSAASPGPFAAAYAHSDKALYSLGGSFDEGASEFPDAVLSGLVVEDFAKGAWDNHSSASNGQATYRTQAQAVLSPNFGSDGFLIVVGGEAPPTKSYVYNEGRSMVEMSAITLYDIANKAWFVQTATGDIPPIRSEFCAVGSPSVDGKTYEMYVFASKFPLLLQILTPLLGSSLAVPLIRPPIWRTLTTRAIRMCTCSPCLPSDGSKPMPPPR